MSKKYTQFNVSKSQRSLDEEEIEPGGYLTKFWVDHPQLGRSLVKLDEETAPGWSEKVVYEIAKLLNLPTARYELGVYNGQQNISLSQNFKDSKLTYINGDTLIRSSLDEYKYNADNSLQALEINEVKLPSDYQPPAGIQNGADLFVGYLMLDTLVTNNDRHGGNWEIGIDNRGEKTLAPVYDNGASFGVDFGSLVYDNKTPTEYTDNIVSMFGVRLDEAFDRATAIRPEAAKVWRSQLEKIDCFTIEGLFNRIPQKLISTKAKTFALELVDSNQQKSLGRNTSVLPTDDRLRQQYLLYKDNFTNVKQTSRSYFDKLLQQEQADVAIVRQIITEYDGDRNLAADKVEAILGQSDRVLMAVDSNNLKQIAQYKLSVVQQAKITKQNPSQSKDRER